jgi:hypothetical protein
LINQFRTAYILHDFCYNQSPVLYYNLISLRSLNTGLQTEWHITT